jgi:hypothetical protein
VRKNWVQGFHGILPKTITNAGLDIDNKFRVEIQNYQNFTKVFLRHQRSKRLIRSIKIKYGDKMVKSSHYLGFVKKEDDYI